MTPRYGRGDRLAALEAAARPGARCSTGRRSRCRRCPASAPPVAICELTPITLAAVVEQRAAGVAGVDRRVGLDHLVDLRSRWAPGSRGRGRRRCPRSRCGRARTGCRSRSRGRRPGRRASRRTAAAWRPPGSPIGVDADDREVARRVDAEHVAVERAPSVAEARPCTCRLVPTTCALVTSVPSRRSGSRCPRRSPVRIETTAGLACGVDRAGARLALLRLDRLARDGRQRLDRVVGVLGRRAGVQEPARPRGAEQRDEDRSATTRPPSAPPDLRRGVALGGMRRRGHDKRLGLGAGVLTEALALLARRLGLGAPIAGPEVSGAFHGLQGTCPGSERRNSFFAVR